MWHKLNEAIRDDPDLDAQEQHLAFLLASYCHGQNTVVYPGLQTLVEKSHWSKPVIIRVLHGLLSKHKILDLGRTTIKQNGDSSHRQIWDLSPFVADEMLERPPEKPTKPPEKLTRPNQSRTPGQLPTTPPGRGQEPPPLNYDMNLKRQLDAKNRPGWLPRRPTSQSSNQGQGQRQPESIGDTLQGRLGAIMHAPQAPLGTPAVGYRNLTDERLEAERLARLARTQEHVVNESLETTLSGTLGD